MSPVQEVISPVQKPLKNSTKTHVPSRTAHQITLMTEGWFNIHMVLIQNICPQNGHKVGSLFRWNLFFKEVYS